MKMYNSFINEDNGVTLRYYAFDWDDNILNMLTKIYMINKIDNKVIAVSTTQFAKLRTSDKYFVNDDSFIDFSDVKKDIFLNDVKKSIKEKRFGPAWNDFIEALVSGSLFAIITARGHESNSIKKAVKYIIYNVLTNEQKTEMGANLMAFANLFDDKDIMLQYNFEDLLRLYLRNCMFVGVSSNSFMKKHPEIAGEHGASNPEKAKEIALNSFILKINRFGKKIKANIKLGFSDDDVKNIKHVNKYFNEIDDIYNINFTTYNTNNPNKIVKTYI